MSSSMNRAIYYTAQEGISSLLSRREKRNGILKCMEYFIPGFYSASLPLNFRDSMGRLIISHSLTKSGFPNDEDRVIVHLFQPRQAKRRIAQPGNRPDFREGENIEWKMEKRIQSSQTTLLFGLSNTCIIDRSNQSVR